MKTRLVLLLCILSLLLTSCGYWIVEEDPIQVGSPTIRTSAASR